MRSAWKTRVAGWIRALARVRPGATRSTSAASSSAVVDRARSVGRRRWPGRSGPPGAPRRSAGRAPPARGRRASRAARRPGRRRLVSKRMSSGPPVRMPKPRSASASWKLDRPRSNSRPSTAAKPAAGATVAELAEVRLAEHEPVAEPGAQPGAGPWRWPPHRRRDRGGGHQGLSLPGSVRCAHRRRAWRRSEGCRKLARVASRPPLPAPDGALPSSRPSIAVRRSRAGPWKRMWCGRSDPEPGEMGGEGIRVLHRLAVVVPGGRRPDLGVVAGPDDDRVAGQPERRAATPG